MVIPLCAAEIESIMQGLDKSGHSMPYSYSISIRGEPVTFCNDKYRQLFLDDSQEMDELDAFNSQRLYAPLLWGKTLSPESHATFFSAVVKASCSSAVESCDTSMLVKVSPSCNL